MKKFILKIKDYFEFSSSKKSGTISGALVYFTLLAIIPLSYLSMLVLSFFNTSFRSALTILLPENFNEVAVYVEETAIKFGARGNVLVFILALYSSANILFHIRRSGEMIYNFKMEKSYILRVVSVVLMMLFILIFSIIVVSYLFLYPYFITFLGKYLGWLVNKLILFTLIFVVVIVINLYACPFKIKLKEVLLGSLYTCLFALIIGEGFFIYIDYFASYEQIYGKIATIIIFLYWLYLLMKGLVGGITLNVYYMGRRRKVKREKKSVKNLFKKNKRGYSG